MKLYSSIEILDLVNSNLNKIVEVQLLLNGGFATHFIYKQKNIIYNEGIDGVRYPISRGHFLEIYKKCNWKLNQII